MKESIINSVLAIGYCFLLAVVSPNAIAQNDDGVSEQKIVPAEGYVWPENNRPFWPIHDWKTAPMESRGIDSSKFALAQQLANNNSYVRSLLVVKNGYLVFEEYFNGGEPEQSTEVWSVTKSFTSALVGIAIDEGHIESVDDLMVQYLPDYPEFEDVTIRHVLTHTTGLEWTEEGDEFVGWISLSM